MWQTLRWLLGGILAVISSILQMDDMTPGGKLWKSNAITAAALVLWLMAELALKRRKAHD